MQNNKKLQELVRNITGCDKVIVLNKINKNEALRLGKRLMLLSSRHEKLENALYNNNGTIHLGLSGDKEFISYVLKNEIMGYNKVPCEETDKELIKDAKFLNKLQSSLFRNGLKTSDGISQFCITLDKRPYKYKKEAYKELLKTS